jgi:PAS domain S-box-containing protein
MLRFLQRLFRRSAGPTDGGDTPRATPPGRATAEAGRRRTEEQFEQLVAGVRDYAIFLLDRHGNVRTWNAGAERIKGYRADEIVGQHFSNFYPADAVSSGWPAHELDVAAATGRFEDEGWRVRKDGTQFWANVVITALRDEAGGVRGFLKITRDMTDRKQAEEKVRRGEERFRLIVEGVKDYAIFMLDPTGHVATWNAGAERLKGYAAREIIGRHFSTFYPEEAVARGWPDEELRRAVAEGRFEDEGWRVRKDGTQFWANVVITALRDEAGTLRGFAKVTRDLTDRKRAEENTRRLLQEEAGREAAEAAAREIERQREQLHVTLASIGDAVIVTDGGGVVTFMNPVAVALTGWEPQEAAGQPLERVFRIVNEDTREPVENPVHRVLREGVVVGLANHTVLVARDGREVPIDDSGAPIRGRGGDVAGVVMVFRDVTEARRAVEARLHLAAIVESSDDAIIGQTLDGTITSWNRGAERLYGYAADEIVGRPLAALAPPDHPDELTGILERVRRGEHIEHYETVRVRKDGGRVDVSLTISPIRDAGGRVVGASKIARDITARKEEDRRRTEFLALLAHELRNPLAPLRNALQVMRLSGDDRASAERTQAMMERQLQHLIRLVDDLLDVSRISQGKLQLRKERVLLAAVVGGALDVCRQVVDQHGHKLTVSLPDEPVEVDADLTRLAQVVCNLLTNAAKFSEPGSRIWLAARREGGEAVVSVRDEGAGIPAPMLTRVFEMFTQVDLSLEKSQGGLGVGLGIVKRLVEMHGGTVEARSEGEGRGSEFVVRLPVAAPAVGTPQPPEQRAEAATPPGRRRILVVDDNADSADSLGRLLGLLGHEARTAYDGESGVAAAGAFRPDVVLMDIGMPRLNGYDAARRIREQPWGKGVVLVALTGWGQEADRRRSQEVGFDAHLVKPVDPAALDKLLAESQATTG